MARKLRKPTNQSILDNPWGEEDVAAYQSFVQKQQAEEEERRVNPFASVTSRSQFFPAQEEAQAAPSRPGIMDILASIPNPLTLPAQAVSGFRQAVEVPEAREALAAGLRSGGQRVVGQAAQVAADTSSLPLQVAAGSLANIGGNFLNLGATTPEGFQDVAGQAMARSRASGQEMESKLAALPNPVQREVVGAFSRAYQSPSSALSAVSGFLGPQGAAIGGTIAGLDAWGGEYVNARQLNKLSVDDATEYATWKTLPAAIEFLPTGGKAATALSGIDRGTVVLEGAKRLLKTAGAEASTEGLQTALAFGIDGVIAKYHPNAALREVALKNLPANAVDALKEIGRSAAAGAAGGATLATPAQGLQLAAEYGKAAADIQRTDSMRKRATALQDRAEAEQQAVFQERAAQREAAREEQEAALPAQQISALEREVETDIAYLQNERANIRRNSSPATLDTDFARIQEIDREISDLQRGITGVPLEVPTTEEAAPQDDATLLPFREEASKLLEKEQADTAKTEKKIEASATATRRAARSKFLETQREATAGLEPEARIDAIARATMDWDSANPMSNYLEAARNKLAPAKAAPSVAPTVAPTLPAPAVPTEAPVATPTAAAPVKPPRATKTDEEFLGAATARLNELMGKPATQAATPAVDITAQQNVGGAREVVATTPRGEFRLVDQAAVAGADFSEFGNIRIVEAYDGDTKIGQLLYANDGTPPTIEVEPEYQRRGVATAMLKLAEEQGGVLGGREGMRPGKPATYRTPAGQAFRAAADTSSVNFRDVLPSTTAQAVGGPAIDIEAAQRIEQELTGKTPIEFAQWAVDNAPDPATKSLAQKLGKRLQELEKIGVTLTTEIQQPATSEEAASRPNVLGSVRLHAPNAKGAVQNLTIAGSKFAEGGGANYETVLHELYHMATLALTGTQRLGGLKDEKITSFMKELESIRTTVIAKLRADARNGKQLSQFEQAALAKENNALADEDELLAWTVSNSDMQELLKRTTVNGQSAWKKIVHALARLFGIQINSPEYNALERVLDIANKLVEADVGLAKEGLTNLGVQLDRRAAQQVGTTPTKRTIIERAKATPAKHRSESFRKLKGVLLTELGIGEKLAEALGHSRGRSGGLTLKANAAGYKLSNAMKKAAAKYERTQRLAGKDVDTAKFLNETSKLIGEEVDKIDQLPDKAARDSALDALDRKYPGVGAGLREMRDMKLQLAAEIIQQHYELGRPLTSKEKATINSIIKNAERYTTRAYLATYNKKAGRKFGEGLMKAYNEDPTSEKGKLIADGLEWLMDEGLVIPDEATMDGMSTSKIERLYAAWIGSRNKKSKEAMIEELSTLPEVSEDEMYDKAMMIVKEMLGLTKKKSAFVSRYIAGESNKQNRTILEARTDIPAPLRKMMGEITDPLLREMISLQRQINLVSKTKLLTEVKKIGEQNGWVSKTETPQNNVQLNDPAYGALNGMWVSGEVVDAISGPLQTLSTADADLSDIMKSPSIFTGKAAEWATKPTEKLSRIQKTSSIVMDVAQMGLNFGGAVFNLALNGISNSNHMVNGMKTASSAVLEQISPRRLTPEQVEALAEVTEAQAIDSATTGEFKGQAGQIIKKTIEKLSEEGEPSAAKWSRAIWRALVTEGGYSVLQAFRATYAFMDVWVKVATYYSNKEFYTEFNQVEGKGWTEEQIRRRSGWEAAGTNISYDRASPLVRTAERVLPVAMFATYFSEVFRTVGMSYVQSMRDFQLAKEATTAEGKQMAAAKGVKRLLGTTLATAGVIGVTLSKLNAEDDDEEKQRNLTDQSYNREKIRIELGKDKDGKPIYFYLNKVDPNGPLNDLAVSVLNKAQKGEFEDLPQTVAKGVTDFFVPATGAISVFKTLADAAAHSYAAVSGNDEWTKADWLKEKKGGVLRKNYPEAYAKIQEMASFGDFGENAVEVAENLFMVGTVKPWIDDRGNIVTTPEGKPVSKNDPRKQWAELGLSVSTSDPEKSLNSKMFDYNKELAGIRKDKKKLLERVGRMSAGDVTEEIASIISEERDAFTKLREHYEGYVSFENRSPRTALNAVEERDAKALRAVQYGRFQPTVLSREVLNKWYEDQLKEKGVDRKELRETYKLLNAAFVDAYRRGE